MKLTPQPAPASLALLRAKRVLPSALGSRQLGKLLATMRGNAFVSARVTQARFLSEAKAAVAEAIAGERESGLPYFVHRMKTLLQQLQYDPSTGFPGDETLGIPPAEPGSLQDLSSWQRLELIYETQLALARGKAQQLASYTPDALRQYPAWELLRVEDRATPRVPDWETRWTRLGYDLTADGRMIALKTSPVWLAIGSNNEALGWSDCLGVSYPPFAFRSGYGVRDVHRSEAQAQGLLSDASGGSDASDKMPADLATYPASVPSTQAVDNDTKARLQSLLQRLRADLRSKGEAV